MERAAKIPQITMHMQVAGSVIDLYWVMTVGSADATTGKNFDALRQKAKMVSAKFIKQLKQKKFQGVAVVDHYNNKYNDGGYWPPNMIVARRVNFSGVGVKSVSDVEDMLRKLGFTTSPIPEQHSRAARVRLTARQTSPSVFKFAAAEVVLVASLLDEKVNHVQAVREVLATEGRRMVRLTNRFTAKG